MKAETVQRPILVKLAAQCTLSQAPALHSKLAGALSRSATVTLDASQAQSIDTAALQILCAFIRDRHSQGLEVCWKGVPPVFEASARRLGLAALLQIPSAHPGRA